MFGLQDVSLTIKARNEVDELNFFRYCANINNDKHESGKTYDNDLPDNGNLNNPNESKEKLQIEHADGSNLDDNNNVIVDSNYCWRNFFVAINFLRILQKLTKKKTHRILLLVQYKSSAILKRILKVSHPLLELYSLKILKNQIPFIGRKWRQGNMKIITSIYLNCRPDLRDEWVASSDADAEIEEALPQEQNLRALIKFYNERNYITHDDYQNVSLYHDNSRNSPDIFPPQYTKPLNHVNSAYIADDIMLDESFLSNWEQWLQDEVYSFSATKPHLDTVDEYYNDDGSFVFSTAGDGSEWDAPVTPPIDEQDPFTSVEWENLTSTDFKTFEHKFKNSGFKLSYDDMEKRMDATTLDDDKDPIYCWPDEMLGPLASSEVTIWQPTPYQSDAED